MKKNIIILLSLIMAFSFTSCSVGQIKQNVLTKLSEMENSLKIIDVSEFGEIVLIDYDINGEMIAMLYEPLISDEREAKEQEFSCSLSLYNIKKGKMIKTAEVDREAYDVAFSGEYVQVWSDSETSIRYDYSLNNCGSATGKAFDCYSIAENIETINTERFVCCDSFAYDSNYIGYDIMVFYNDCNNYYIAEHSNSNILSSCNKLVLESSGEDNLTLTVKDYASKRIVNSMELESEAIFLDRGIIKDDAVCFNTIDDYGKLKDIYYWDYRDNACNESFDFVIVNDKNCLSQFSEICNDIMESCQIHLEINPDRGIDDSFYEWNDTGDNSRYLLCAYDLKYCLEKLPNPIFSEILCNDIEDAVMQFKRLNIFLVGEVADENIRAYANITDDELYIVYGCRTFDYSTFFHEMMHIMEYRIRNLEPDFDAEWEKLNPKDFYYTADYDTLYYENEAFQDYFARSYGMTNALEDRATVFELLCDNASTDAEPWWREKEPLAAKADFLKDALQKSYPSLENQAILNIK